MCGRVGSVFVGVRLWMGLCLVGEWIMVCVFEVGYGFGVLFLDGV